MWRIFSMVFGVMLGLPAMAQVYEWIDDRGNRHFSDQKPEGIEYRILGNPADNLSSYAPSAIRQAPSASRSGDESTSSSRKARRSAGTSSRQDIEAVCADYLRRIDRIQQQLRAGYSEPRGNRLRARRSALQSAYRDACN